MSRTMARATKTGLLICDRIKKASLDYIAEWDPDLHYDIMKARKKMGIKE